MTKAEKLLAEYKKELSKLSQEEREKEESIKNLSTEIVKGLEELNKSRFLLVPDEQKPEWLKFLHSYFSKVAQNPRLATLEGKLFLDQYKNTEVNFVTVFLIRILQHFKGSLYLTFGIYLISLLLLHFKLIIPFVLLYLGLLIWNYTPFHHRINVIFPFLATYFILIYFPEQVKSLLLKIQQFYSSSNNAVTFLSLLQDYIEKATLLLYNLNFLEKLGFLLILSGIQTVYTAYIEAKRDILVIKLSILYEWFHKHLR